MYEKVYEPLSEESDPVPWVKLIDVGRQIIANRTSGYLAGRLVFFLMNLRIQKEPIFISRHGESEYNIEDKIGGDSSLTDNVRFSFRFLSFFFLSFLFFCFYLSRLFFSCSSF
jgi:hypothetical protein